MFGVGAVAVLAYALLALRAVWLSLIESARAPQMPGFFPILAGASVAIGITLAREALAPYESSSSLARRIARSFGYGWVAGVAATVLITIVKLMPESSRPSIGDVVLGLFNYLIVSLMLSIPGLLALTLTRRPKPP